MARGAKTRPPPRRFGKAPDRLSSGGAAGRFRVIIVPLLNRYLHPGRGATLNLSRGNPGISDERIRAWGQNLALAAAYSALYEVARYLSFPQWMLTSGLRLAFLLLLPTRFW